MKSATHHEERQSAVGAEFELTPEELGGIAGGEIIETSSTKKDFEYPWVVRVLVSVLSSVF
jgi:hypothetical protein